MTATRVFIARLAGIGVFDPVGDQLGRVRDVVTMLRIGAEPPRILGLVVEMPHRHRIFVSMGRVTRIENDAVVLSTGNVNLKRFEQRSGEMLVLHELLDRQVTIVEDGSAVTIVDAAMEQNRNRDWLIQRLAVRGGGGSRIPGRRRRGQLYQVEWDEISGLSLASAAQSADTLIALLGDMHTADLAAAMLQMTPKRRHEVAAALPDGRLADVLEELSEEDSLEILRALEDERAADVLEEMNDDDAADLLGDLPAADQERLLELMEPDEAAPVRRLMSYADYTAGGMMTSEPIIVTPDATVAEALARLRNADITPALASQVYVVRPPQATPTGRYLGIAHLQRLLREPPSALVSGVADNDIDPLSPDVTLADVARHMATYNLLAAPVIDDADRLLGAIAVDDVLDHLLPENWRDADG